MSTEMMAPRKNKRSNASRAIAQAIINEYKPNTAEDMQEALKDIFGPMFESMLQGEMDSHLGYENNEFLCIPPPFTKGYYAAAFMTLIKDFFRKLFPDRILSPASGWCNPGYFNFDLFSHRRCDYLYRV